MNQKKILGLLYQKLLNLYPREFNERFGVSMAQTFNDLYQEQKTAGNVFSFVPWMFVETAAGILKEYGRVVSEGDLMKNTSANLRYTALISTILLVVAYIVAPWIYLVGNLRDALGPFAYAIADFLYGPVWSASLVGMVFVLRERLGAHAPRRMSLAFLTTMLSAGITIAIACIRSANRQYHLTHPELHLEDSTTVLVLWATLIAGLTGAAWHSLGWSMLLIGSAGWNSHRFPRLLSGLYLLLGINSLFVYLLPDSAGSAVLLGIIVSIWQGFWLWNVDPAEQQQPEPSPSSLA